MSMIINSSAAYYLENVKASIAEHYNITPASSDEDLEYAADLLEFSARDECVWLTGTYSYLVGMRGDMRDALADQTA